MLRGLPCCAGGGAEPAELVAGQPGRFAPVGDLGPADVLGRGPGPHAFAGEVSVPARHGGDPAGNGAGRGAGCLQARAQASTWTRRASSGSMPGWRRRPARR